MITAEKINVYDSFNGLEDGLALTATQRQKDLFKDNDDWFLLMNFYQDILLINDNLASNAFRIEAISRMKAHCDAEAFSILYKRIAADC